MAARTALVTGALGQDGRLLSSRLVDAGYRVVGLVRPQGTHADADRIPGVEYRAPDLAHDEAVRSLLRELRPDVVHHLAAFHHASQDDAAHAALSSWDAMVVTNFLTTKALAFGILREQPTCCLVFASSSQIHTATDGVHDVDERTARQPATFYGHVKSWSMDLLAHLRAEAGLRGGSAILFNHESPLRGPQFVSRKITRAAAAAKHGVAGAIELRNVGARVDWSSAQDVVQALQLIGESATPRDYVVASGELHSVRELLEAAFGHVGLDWRRYVRHQLDELAPALRGRPEAIERDLGWRRTVSFESLVAQMVDADLALLRGPDT